MARPLYRLDRSDPWFPQIVQLLYEPGRIGSGDDEEGMQFGEAKRQLLECIRDKRDHWTEQLRIAKKMTPEDCQKEGKPLTDVL